MDVSSAVHIKSGFSIVGNDKIFQNPVGSIDIQNIAAWNLPL